MDDLLKLVSILTEYSDEIYVDYDRFSALVVVDKKFVKDIYKKIEFLPFDITMKTEKTSKKLFIVFTDVVNEELFDGVNSDECDD